MADSRLVSGLLERDYGVLPFNMEAEMALLGAMLIDKRVIDDVVDVLKADHFADPVHRDVYDAMLRLIAMGIEPSPVTLSRYANSAPIYTDVGGAKYLVQLAQSVISTVNAKDYAVLIRDLAMRRALIQFSWDLKDTVVGADLERTADSIVEAAEQKLLDIIERGTAEGGLRSIGSIARDLMRQLDETLKTGKRPGLSTGFVDVDAVLGGLFAADLFILAGRPSMGKTALATTIGYRAAQAGNPVAVFSLEMSEAQLGLRVISAETLIESTHIRDGKVADDQVETLVRASARMQDVPLYVEAITNATVSHIRAAARRMKRKHGLKLIIIDYLQLMVGESRRQGNLTEEVTIISRALKALAIELQVPVLALSQLSRAVESRDDKRPTLADLRQSGAIEQDADVVGFVYREAYYLERSLGADAEHDVGYQRARNTAELIIAKQRNGPAPKTVKLFFSPAFTLFSNLEKQHAES